MQTYFMRLIPNQIKTQQKTRSTSMMNTDAKILSKIHKPNIIISQKIKWNLSQGCKDDPKRANQ